MERAWTIILLLFGAVTIVFLAGCAGKAAPVGEQNQTATDVPQWSLNPPEDSTYYYAVGSAVGRSLPRAKSRAEGRARSALALQIESEVTTIINSFEVKVREREDTEVTSLLVQVSTTVSRQGLRGLTLSKIHSVQEGARYRAYVLMKLPRSATKVAVVDAIQKERELYNRFRTSHVFQELEAEIEKLAETKQ